MFHSHIKEYDNELLRSKPPILRIYIPKIGYKAKYTSDKQKDTLVVEEFWKIGSPLKNRIVMWLAIKNTALTWEVLQKRNGLGQSRCTYVKGKRSSSKKEWIRAKQMYLV